MLKVGPMSQVRRPSDPGDSGQEAASPAVRSEWGWSQVAGLALSHHCQSHSSSNSHKAPSWRNDTATARPSATASEALVRCSFIDNLSHLQKVADYLSISNSQRQGGKTAGTENGVGQRKWCCSEKEICFPIFTERLFILQEWPFSIWNTGFIWAGKQLRSISPLQLLGLTQQFDKSCIFTWFVIYIPVFRGPPFLTRHTFRVRN